MREYGQAYLKDYSEMQHQHESGLPASSQLRAGVGVSEARKTAILVGVAILLTGLAWVTAPRTTAPKAFQDRGASFFPGFIDPRMVQSLEVVDFDADTATAHPFQVQVRDGLWTIPSYYDYPADAGERLAKGVAEIIALKKDNVASENVSDHERTGTLDPLDETLPTLRGRGKRITFKGENDRILADVIVGNELEGRPQFRYVRLAEQSRVYVAEVGDLDVSSKFLDWIDRDLLHIRWSDLDQAIIRDYSLDKTTHSVQPRDTLFLQKLGQDEDNVVHWTMRGLQTGEQVDTFRANLLNTTLDELSVAGVRPKPPSIVTRFAQTNGTVKVSRDDLVDLENKGFHFTAKGELLSDGGEILAHTTTGMFFHLWFGAIAYGTAENTSIAPTTAATGTNQTSSGGAAHATASAAASNPTPIPNKKVAAAPTVNRYLIVTATFDPTAIAEKAARDAAEKQVEVLQRRYAPWYYIVSGQSFDRLLLSRRALVKQAAIPTPK
jgi:hypothetical protein